MTKQEAFNWLIENARHEEYCSWYGISTVTGLNSKPCTCQTGEAIEALEGCVVLPKKVTPKMREGWSNYPTKLIISNAVFQERYNVMIKAENES